MNQRISYFDSLKGLAIIGVVFIHTLKYKDASSVDFSIVFRQSINFSVPLFLALSGFFLAEKQFKYKTEYFSFLKKRIPRVYLPYAVWSIVYIFINIVTVKDLNIGKQVFNFLTFRTKGIFYFVALIIQYYILLPVLQKYFGKNLLLLSMMISFIAAIMIFIYQYYSQHDLPLILYAGNAFSWILFFVLGMYLKKNKIRIKKSVVGALVVFALGLSVAETYFQIYLTGNIGNAVSAIKISSFIYSACIIILFLNYTSPSRTIFYDLGKVSYAIYLIHLLVLVLVTKIFLTFNIDYYSIITEIMIGAFTVLVSYLICIVLRKINPLFSAKYLGI